ncbi:ImmA/IrrE family metallo-endopeptidase [Pseudomonas sp. KHPS1]|nr:ImmA/IrrE family metallo-endopeptidase [Pseudomonas sp. KHPS1]ATH83146.1 methenyltetrahydrofolate cyclohydrolase [Pseudomonas mendocina]UTH37851.1 ImmA/IrrE family metallo-endopeptidase [Pseudomonas sp. KHPS1]
MNEEQIREAVGWLHREIWDGKELLWPDHQPTPIQMLQPDAAAHILGFDYDELPNLGSPRFGRGNQQYRAAGVLNRPANKIAISLEYPLHVRRFTGAHEIGHCMLHDDEIMHRDMPLDGGPRNGRPSKEREADYFAACFLMPARLLTQAFAAQFGFKGPFPFNDVTCFHLNPVDPQALLDADTDSLDREIALARCARFNNRNLIPLAVQFGVSNVAMAIRIRELKLTLWP